MARSKSHDELNTTDGDLQTAEIGITELETFDDSEDDDEVDDDRFRSDEMTDTLHNQAVAARNATRSDHPPSSKSNTDELSPHDAFRSFIRSRLERVRLVESSDDDDEASMRLTVEPMSASVDNESPADETAAAQDSAAAMMDSQLGHNQAIADNSTRQRVAELPSSQSNSDETSRRRTAAFQSFIQSRLERMRLADSSPMSESDADQTPETAIIVDDEPLVDESDAAEDSTMMDALLGHNQAIEDDDSGNSTRQRADSSSQSNSDDDDSLLSRRAAFESFIQSRLERVRLAESSSSAADVQVVEEDEGAPLREGRNVAMPVEERRRDHRAPSLRNSDTNMSDE